MKTKMLILLCTDAIQKCCQQILFAQKVVFQWKFLQGICTIAGVFSSRSFLREWDEPPSIFDVLVPVVNLFLVSNTHLSWKLSFGDRKLYFASAVDSCFVWKPKYVIPAPHHRQPEENVIFLTRETRLSYLPRLIKWVISFNLTEKAIPCTVRDVAFCRNPIKISRSCLTYLSSLVTAGNTWAWYFSAETACCLD